MSLHQSLQWIHYDHNLEQYGDGTARAEAGHTWEILQIWTTMSHEPYEWFGLYLQTEMHHPPHQQKYQDLHVIMHL